MQRTSQDWRDGGASGPPGPLRAGKREIRPLGITTLTLWWITLNLDRGLVKIFRLPPEWGWLSLVGDMLPSQPIISDETSPETLSANHNAPKLLVHHRMKSNKPRLVRNMTLGPCPHPTLPCLCIWIGQNWCTGLVWADAATIFHIIVKNRDRDDAISGAMECMCTCIDDFFLSSNSDNNCAGD